MKFFGFSATKGSAITVTTRRGGLFAAGILILFVSLPVWAQQADPSAPVIVQPGAPGKATRTLPTSTRATLPPSSSKDIEFMQGMIMHHAQAVEMTALIGSHTTSKDLSLLGARISHSQSEEIRFMRRWLEARGESTEMPTKMGGANMSAMDMSGMDMSKHKMLMPGMLTKAQMDALRNAQGKEF